MNRDQATAALSSHANPLARVVFKTRDATGDYWLTVGCWLDNGVLVMAHPTDASRGPIDAPADAEYSIEEPSADEIAWREEQERLEGDRC